MSMLLSQFTQQRNPEIMKDLTSSCSFFLFFVLRLESHERYSRAHAHYQGIVFSLGMKLTPLLASLPVLFTLFLDPNS